MYYILYNNDKKSMVYTCKLCDKEYKTYQTLWKHNKIFHTNICKPMSNDVNTVSSLCQMVSNNNKGKQINCELCNKIFNTRQAKSFHKKKCVVNSNKDKDIELEKVKLMVAKEETLRLKEEKEILRLKIKLSKSKKVDGITLK